MAYYIGVDLGGTNIKAAVVNDAGEILAEANCPTALPRPAESVAEDIVGAVDRALLAAGLPREGAGGLGVGCPGTIDPQTGMVVYSNNLGWRDFPLGAFLHERTGLPVRAGNDANVAALGEALAGSAKGAQSAVIITLGTGVGSGVVLDGQILTGFSGAASEFGHMVIKAGGRPCTCGRKGCLEAYASATGLINLTAETMETHPESLMHEIAREGGVDGRTAFTAAKRGDAAGQAVVDAYISDLACGIANIVNALQPEVISLGGGIAKEGPALLEPLRKQVYAQVFGGTGKKFTRIVACTLGYKAGLIGAALLTARA